jgi:hypothetical protein
MLPTKFRFIWQNGFRGEEFKKSANQKQESPVAVMFVNKFGQAVSEKKIFLNRSIRNKNCLWQPCLLMDREEMSKLYRGPSIDASYQVSVHLAKGVSEENIKM